MKDSDASKPNIQVNRGQTSSLFSGSSSFLPYKRSFLCLLSPKVKNSRLKLKHYLKLTPFQNYLFIILLFELVPSTKAPNTTLYGNIQNTPIDIENIPERVNNNA